jgi:predicted deacetylase
MMGGIVKKKVPVLITWDVDPDRWATCDDRQRALSMTMDLCEEVGVRSTFFMTANFAHEYPDHIERMQILGHELGCHGLTHTDEEEYNRMPEGMQRSYIEEATRKLEAIAGVPMRAFRSPRVKISSHTLSLLAEYGYLADSSVCSQRVDFVTSNLVNPGWLVAPRRPYRPNRTNPFKRGDLPIWEIPVSAMILPFISGSLSVFGLRFMKAYFRSLCAESRFTGKPIVYLAHPTEFILVMGNVRNLIKRHLFTPKFFSPRYVRTHGFLARNLLRRMDGESLFNNFRELLAYMVSLPDVAFMTSSEYVNYLENHAGMVR